MDFVFVEVDEDREATIVRARDGDLERVEVDGVTLAGGLSCTTAGDVLLDGVGAAGLPPLMLEESSLVELARVPVGGSPSFVGEDRFAWEDAAGEGGLRIRIYDLDGEPLTPHLPGDDPFWLSKAGLLAVEGAPDSPFGQLGVYTLDLSALPTGDEIALDITGYSERVSLLPFPTVQLDPEGRRVAYVTASQENEQNDVQVIDVDGRSGARTLTTTAEQETITGWTRDGRIIFVRHQLREQDDPDDTVRAAEIVVIDPESGDEEVVASGRGVEALVACH